MESWDRREPRQRRADADDSTEREYKITHTQGKAYQVATGTFSLSALENQSTSFDSDERHLVLAIKESSLLLADNSPATLSSDQLNVIGLDSVYDKIVPGSLVYIERADNPARTMTATVTATAQVSESAGGPADRDLVLLHHLPANRVRNLANVLLVDRSISGPADRHLILLHHLAANRVRNLANVLLVDGVARRPLNRNLVLFPDRLANRVTAFTHVLLVNRLADGVATDDVIILGKPACKPCSGIHACAVPARCGKRSCDIPS